MAAQTISHLYKTYDEAVQAVYELEKAGVPADDISMVGSADPRLPPGVSEDQAQSPAVRGAAIGATALGGVALLAGLGAVTIPGLGPLVAAGWFAAAMAGIGVCAAAGGLAGALTQLGLNRHQAHHAAEGIQAGGTLVLVRNIDARTVPVESILEQDHRAEARLFEEDSPIVDFVGADAARGSAGDYGDELAKIDRAEDRIQTAVDRDR